MAVNVAPTVLRLERTRRRSRRRGKVMLATCTTTVDAKRGGGSEDLALYACGCGYAFKAAVTTSVDCPQCGAGQAW